MVFGLTTSVDFVVSFDDDNSKRPQRAVIGSRADVFDPNIDDDEKQTKRNQVPIFRSDEAISGMVQAKFSSGKSVEHQGIKVEFIGSVETSKGESKFLVVSREVAGPGVLEDLQTFRFDFGEVMRANESYNGDMVKLRYFVRTTLSRSYLPDMSSVAKLLVQRVGSPPKESKCLKMEVGIEECLHIEFEYNKADFHLNDVVVGRVNFLLVRIKIKYMELAILRRESILSRSNPEKSLSTDNHTVTRFEIMDGAPIKGESIPVRLYLGAYDLTPSYHKVAPEEGAIADHEVFSVKYYLNLVLVDVEDRRYFKQQEITLWRKDIG